MDQGEICIDGIDVKTYDLQKLRASIGFVPQKALLFSGSIEENLRYGKENATHDELEVAVHQLVRLSLSISWKNLIDII